MFTSFTGMSGIDRDWLETRVQFSRKWVRHVELQPEKIKNINKIKRVIMIICSCAIYMLNTVISSNFIALDCDTYTNLFFHQFFLWRTYSSLIISSCSKYKLQIKKCGWFYNFVNYFEPW